MTSGSPTAALPLSTLVQQAVGRVDPRQYAQKGAVVYFLPAAVVIFRDGARGAPAKKADETHRQAPKTASSKEPFDPVILLTRTDNNINTQTGVRWRRGRVRGSNPARPILCRS